MHTDLSEIMSNKDEGWYRWLQDHGLDDPCLDEEELYLRYYKFHKINWGLYQDDVTAKAECL